MKKLLTLLILFSSISAAQLLNPKLVLQQNEYDFGDIDYGTEYQHSFVFINNSSDTLSIETIRTDCGCTVPDWENTFTMPGASGEISVTYTPKKHGYFSEKVRVFFFEQKKPVILNVEGYVFKY